MAHNLFFGRFLNEELNSIPDIDLDFPREIRERLIERVYEKFGHENAALVCAFSTYRLRSAVRDVGKALGLPLPELDKIAKLSEPRRPKIWPASWIGFRAMPIARTRLPGAI